MTGDARTPTAAAVIIGNEILSGKVRDENTPFLVDTLRGLGVALKRVSVVPDEAEAVVEAVRDAHARFDWVFTSGGVGPTHDDITIACVAAALGRRVVRDAELEEILRRLFGERLKEAHLRMADVVEGTELIADPEMVVPVMQVANVFVLPGVPEIFREKILVLKERLAAVPYHVRYVYLTLGEGALAPLLDSVVARFPDVDVGSYPSIRAQDYRVRITLESKDPVRTEAATDAFLALVDPERVVRVEDPTAGAAGA